MPWPVQTLPSKELLLPSHGREGLVLSTPGAAQQAGLWWPSGNPALFGSHCKLSVETCCKANNLIFETFSDTLRPVLHYSVTFQIGLKFSQLRQTKCLPSLCRQSLVFLKCSFSSLSFSHSSSPPYCAIFLISTEVILWTQWELNGNFHFFPCWGTICKIQIVLYSFLSFYEVNICSV